MKYSPSNLTEIKQGLSKKIYRNSTKKNKIYIDYSNEKINLIIF